MKPPSEILTESFLFNVNLVRRPIFSDSFGEMRHDTIVRELKLKGHKVEVWETHEVAYYLKVFPKD